MMVKMTRELTEGFLRNLAVWGEDLGCDFLEQAILNVKALDEKGKLKEIVKMAEFEGVNEIETLIDFLGVDVNGYVDGYLED